MTRQARVDWVPEAVAEVRTRLQALWRLRLGEGPTAVAAGVGVSMPCSSGCAGTGKAAWQRCAPIGGAVRASPPT